MKPAMKEILTAHFRAVLFFVILGLMIHGCFSVVFSQEKAKPDTTITLGRGKIMDRLRQIEASIQKRQKELFDADPLIRELVGQYNGLASSITDPALAVTDTTKKASKSR